MLDLFSFFDGMSKPLLRDVHARAYGKKGLLNNALIQSEVLTYFSDRDRVAKLFAHMEPWQKRCLNLVYHSASRGLTYNELRLTVPVAKNKELRTFLLDMCREYLLWRSQVSGTSVYRGFADFARCFEIEPQESVDASKSFVEYGCLLDWHVCLVLSLAKRGEMRINTNGTLHRRSYQICTSAFVTASKISAKAAENELSLIFNFLTQKGWLEQENSKSMTAGEWIRRIVDGMGTGSVVFRNTRKGVGGFPKRKLDEICLEPNPRYREMVEAAAENDLDSSTDIQENGETEMFSQSDKTDPYERERPAARLFTATDKNYQSIIKQLNDLCPPDQEVDDLAEFLSRG